MNTRMLRGLAAVVGLSSVAAATLLTATASASQVLLVDLNTNAGVGGPGGTWNSYATPADINGGVLLDATGAATLYTLSRSGTFTDNSNSGTSLFDPATTPINMPAWVAAGGNNGAAGDNFYTNNSATGPQDMVLTFGNLPVGAVVSIDVLASRDSASASGFFDYSIDGNTWTGFTVLNGDGTAADTNGWDTNSTVTQSFSLQTQGHALHRYMHAEAVTIGSGGTLSIRSTDASSATSNFTAINALRLTNVPEPGAAGLLLAGGLLFGLRRRRRLR